MPPRILRARRATPPARAPGLVYPRKKELLLPGVAREITRAQLKLLVEALRNQPGVNVRPPSHQAPPIRALDLDVARTVLLNVTAATPTGRVVVIRFVCPDRHAGVLTSFAIGVTRGATNDANAWLVRTDNTLFLTINSRPILQTTQGVTLGGVAASEAFDGLKAYISRPGTANAGPTFDTGLGTEALQPIMVPFFSQDVIEFGFVEGTVVGTAIDVNLGYRLKGYYYPQRTDTGDRGILGTIVD